MARHLVVPVTLRFPVGTEFPTHALIDTGATANFVNKALVSSLNLPQQVQQPRQVFVIDKRPIKSGLVTHCMPTTLVIHDHQEEITLQIADIGDYPIILGIPWLRLHQPAFRLDPDHLAFQHPCPCSMPSVSINASVEPTLTSTPPEPSLTPAPPSTILHKYYPQYINVFSKSGPDILPMRRACDHSIPIQSGKTVPFGRLYKLSPRELETLRDYIDENLKKGFIRPSTSPAGAPGMFVKKKNNTLRYVVDYRGLNQVTIKNRLALPLISETLERLQGCSVFTKIDLKNAYHLIRIADGDEWKTAFRTKYGHFEYTVMPFGLTNAPATFQAFMNDIFRPFLDTSVVVYLDDILVFSKSLPDHIPDVSRVLAVLQNNNLYASLDKCVFHSSSVEFLGHVVTPTSLQMSADKVQSITSWPTPCTIKQVQSFLGLANYYRRFIHNFSAKARPLTQLTRKNMPFIWNPPAQSAFDSLKASFISHPVLRHWDPAATTILETDASQFALGAILSQYDESGALHPVAFHSRKFSDAELNYAIHDKELLAIIASLTAWRHYLLGIHFTIWTDHKNLLYFAQSQSLNHRQTRWSIILADYDYTLMYRPGHTNKADLLSRRCDYALKGDDTTRKRVLLDTSRLDFPEPASPEPASDLTLAASSNAIYTISPDPLHISIPTHYTLADKAQADDDMSPLSWNPAHSFILHNTKIYVPESLRTQVLNQHHDTPTAGHPGITRTVDLVSRKFSWPGLRATVKDYVSACSNCARSKSARHKPYGTLQSLPVPERPWSSISADFITGLPNSSGSNAILVIVDRLTKFAYFLPCCNTINADQLTRTFLRHVWSIHGLPDTLITDRGSLFTSRFWSRLLQILGTSRSLSTAFHPRTDGQTERVNQILEAYLRAYVNYEQDNWSELLPLAQYAYNNAKHSAIQTSPFFANFGYHPTAFPTQVDTTSTTPAAEERARNLVASHENLKTLIKEANERYAKYFDRRVSAIMPQFNEGDDVWLLTKNIRMKRPSRSLSEKKIGPFRIIKKINDVAFKLELPPTLKIHPVFHVNLLEPVVTDNFPDRTTATPTLPEILPEELPPESSIVRIIDSRTNDDGTIDYLVEWDTFDNISAELGRTWLPQDSSDIQAANDLVKVYDRRGQRS